METRLPPKSPELEGRVLGAVLSDRDAYPLVDFLRPDDFSDPPNSLIWEAASWCHGRGFGTMPDVVGARLEALGILASAGGRTRLWELATASVTSLSAAGDAKSLKEMADVRRVAEAAGRARDRMLGWGGDRDSAVGDAVAGFLGAVDRASDSSPKSARELADSYWGRLGEDRGKGEPTGFRDLDSFFQGFRPGELTVVGARPALGKSNLCLNLVRNFCRRGKRCLVLSLEMSEEEVMARLVSGTSGIPMGNAPPEERAGIAFALGEISDWGIMLDDSPRLTVDTLRSKARLAKSRLGGLDFAVVDYLGLMEAEGRGERWEKMGAVSRGLKTLAKSMGCSIICAHQINREAEKGKDGRPKLHQLSSSGSIEADADHVFLIYRRSADPNVRAEDLTLEDRLSAEVILAKNRHGPTGKARLAFDGPRATFADWGKG